MSPPPGCSRASGFQALPRELLNEETPLYSNALVESARTLLPELRVHEASDVNHYTIVMSDEGAEQVATRVRTQVAGSNDSQ